MNLVICTDYDFRSSRVASTVSRWPLPLGPFEVGDTQQVVVTLIRQDGSTDTRGGASGVTPYLTLTRATGQELAATTQAASTVPGGWVITLPIEGHPSINQEAECEFEVVIAGPSGLSQTVARLPVLTYPET
jgi:hypothetical protein